MYILLVNNVVVQKQPNIADGFVWTDSDVVCGQIKDGSNFVNPQPVVIPLTSEQVRDNALAAIDAYDYGDGRVIQIRTKDRDNLIGGIAKATPIWKMLDNKVYAVTVADLQAALDNQEAQIAAIWMAHFADLEQGVLL
tara:strand:- start:567 stop:980 length:414 start_codon:yes stop_codon:yes gene_type:complete